MALRCNDTDRQTTEQDQGWLCAESYTQRHVNYPYPKHLVMCIRVTFKHLPVSSQSLTGAVWQFLTQALGTQRTSSVLGGMLLGVNIMPMDTKPGGATPCVCKDGGGVMDG